MIAIEPWCPRRLVIASRVSAPAAEGVEIARRIAAPGTVELEAILVEDGSLASVATLPFTREVDRSSGALRRFDPARAARLGRIARMRAREAVSGLDRTLSPRIVRGSLGRAAAQAGAAADVVVITAAIAPGERSLSGARAERSVAVIYHDDEASRTALSLAARLAAERLVALHVLLIGRSDQGLPTAIWARAVESLGARAPDRHLHRVEGESLPSLEARLRQGRMGLLVVGHSARTPPREELIGSPGLGCPVVLVRA